MIFGPSGSMGKLISNLALMDEEIKVVAALDVENIGSNLTKVIGSNSTNDVKIRDVKDLQEVINNNKLDVAVEFTTASATEQNGIICVKNNIRCVIGTTGLSERFLNKFNSLVVEHNSPAVLSSNMAPGVNVLFK
ncbi:MAG: hypothetical protein GF353_29290, partial [Candidatus Lokiarchaeota archaeon]|nr:hypothetical protein [Candidatus Lokiarchaeota archaeon]